MEDCYGLMAGGGCHRCRPVVQSMGTGIDSLADWQRLMAETANRRVESDAVERGPCRLFYGAGAGCVQLGVHQTKKGLVGTGRMRRICLAWPARGKKHSLVLSGRPGAGTAAPGQRPRPIPPAS